MLAACLMSICGSEEVGVSLDGVPVVVRLGELNYHLAFVKVNQGQQHKQTQLPHECWRPLNCSCSCEMSASLWTCIITWWRGRMTVLRLEYKMFSPVLISLFFRCLSCRVIMWFGKWTRWKWTLNVKF